jgi:hypothetical protein
MAQAGVSIREQPEFLPTGGHNTSRRTFHYPKNINVERMLNGGKKCGFDPSHFPRFRAIKLYV